MKTLPFLVCGALLLAASSPGFARVERSVVERFALESGGTLRIDTYSGPISVQAGDGSEVRVEIKEVIEAGSEKEADEFLADLKLERVHEAGVVGLTARYEGERKAVRRWFSWGRGNNWPPVRLEFTVTVPRTCDLDLKTAGGSITVGDLAGRVAARTSGGRIELGRIRGEVDVRTSGGPIEIVGCTGPLEARTSGGGISLGKIEGPAKVATSGGHIKADAIASTLDARTSGGGIKVRFTAPLAGACALHSSGGSIEVTLPAGTRCDLEARTSGGSVRSDFDVTTTSRGGDDRSKSRLSGTINGGGPGLTLRTSGGSIRVREG